MSTDAPDDPAAEMRVLLLPPTTRDAAAMLRLLSAAGIPCTPCPNMPSLCEALAEGAGVIVVSEEALTGDPHQFVSCIRSQPVWSDVPIIVLSRGGSESPGLAPLLGSLGNVSVLERPIRVSTLLSIVRSTLRARDRQYQVRSHFSERLRAEQELRASEGRLRLALHTGKLGVWERDLTTNELTCTPACKANYGRAPDEPFSYDDLTASIHPEDAAKVRTAARQAVSDHAEYDIEYRNIWPDGTVHWLLVRGQAEYATDGTPLRLVGVTLDITDRKTDEERRAALLEAERMARAEAERAGRMKDEFLATLGHELRTPLNAILGWAQILKLNLSDAADVAEGIAVIDRNARAQTQIIEDLLDMSRIISGKVRLDVQRVDLAATVQAAVDTVKPAADAKGVRLHVVLDPLAGAVSGDPSRLQQVFWNLLSNSVKFSPRGSRVQVLLERVNSHLEVSVIDSGEGIKPEFLPHVFERFRQADGSTTRKHGGLGLGLSIVKQLVELHGGQARAKSPGEGKGATFTVILPLTALHSEPEPQRRHPQAPASFGTLADDACVRLNGVKVLVVDDEPDARALVKRLLEDCEAVVATAGSAAEALRMFMEDRPQVVVSDIGMPGEDGYALVRKIRSLPASSGGAVPAIALTAYARSEDRTRAMLAGFQTHVSKPVEPSELVATVASLATRGALERNE
ncbi:MAG TPA: ATP-binding protein [Tepidisphaeraceae bacterium]|jgi:hypothetical protein|nr:ATP-binding protein [Tepidisphaeraceae bacterium]